MAARVPKGLRTGIAGTNASALHTACPRGWYRWPPLSRAGQVGRSGQMYGDGIPGPGDLGRRVAAHRKQLGWSRQQLAAKAGLSPAYRTFIEGLPAGVPMACLVGLADALGTTVAALLGADPADQDGATTAPAPAGPWVAGVRTGLPGERPLPSLG